MKQHGRLTFCVNQGLVDSIYHDRLQRLGYEGPNLPTAGWGIHEREAHHEFDKTACNKDLDVHMVVPECQCSCQ